jgi:hypothetical protein
VSRKGQRRALPASGGDELRAIIEAEVNKIDWKKQAEFQESLGRPDLSKKEFRDFLRVKGLGLPTPWERLLGHERLSLQQAFEAPREGFLTPLETAVNEIVWQVDRKWLCPTPNMEIRPRTDEQRISGYAILEVVRQLYGLPEGTEIWLSHTRLDTKEELYNVRLFMPGVSIVKDVQQLLRR